MTGKISRYLKLSMKEEINIRKNGLSNTIKNHGFATAQDFYRAFYTAKMLMTNMCRQYRNGKKLIAKSLKREKLSQNPYSGVI